MCIKKYKIKTHFSRLNIFGAQSHGLYLALARELASDKQKS